MTQTKKAEVVLLAVFITMSVVSIIQSNNIVSMQMSGELITSKFYLILINAFFLLTLFARLGLVLMAKTTATGAEKSAKPSGNSKMMYILMACAVAYAFGITVVGFYVTTFAFLCGIYITLEGLCKRNAVVGILFATLICGIFAGVFELLSIYLPSTLLF